MMCIGESFGDYGEYVNGVVASARGKQYRLQIWTKDEVKEHNEVIGNKILNQLPPNYRINMEFVVSITRDIPLLFRCEAL